MEKLKPHIIWGLISVLILLPAFWLIMDRDSPIDEMKGYTIPNVVSVDESVEIHWDIKFNRTCPFTVTRELIDSKGIIWNYSAIKYLESGSTYQKHIIVPLKTPYTIGHGKVSYQSTLSFKCNAYHEFFNKPIIVKSPILHFQVK